jgi:hypothetical protein
VLAGADGAVKESLIGKASGPAPASSAPAAAPPAAAPEPRELVTERGAPAPQTVTSSVGVEHTLIAELATGVLTVGQKVRQIGGAAINGDVKRVNAIEKRATR